MSGIVIRKAGIDDASKIYEIDQDYIYERYTLDMISSSLSNDNNLNLILEVDNEAIGYLSAGIVLEDCELFKIVVKKDYQKMGYGKKLIEELKKYSVENDIKSIFLEVREDNFKAKNLYENYGFQKISERKGYYDGIDALIYRCDID